MGFLEKLETPSQRQLASPTGQSTTVREGAVPNLWLCLWVRGLDTNKPLIIVSDHMYRRFHRLEALS